MWNQISTSICASVTKETYQPQHKIITADPYAKKKINKQNIRYLKFDSTWFLGINYFMLKAEKGGEGYCAGIFLRKNNSMLVKKIRIGRNYFMLWLIRLLSYGCTYRCSVWENMHRSLLFLSYFDEIAFFLSLSVEIKLSFRMIIAAKYFLL
jgi:hypothetical protein